MFLSAARLRERNIVDRPQDVRGRKIGLVIADPFEYEYYCPDERLDSPSRRKKILESRETLVGDFGAILGSHSASFVELKQRNKSMEVEATHSLSNQRSWTFRLAS
jgi:hypothetical protein